MPNVKNQVISGWGNTPVVSCAAYRPEKHRDLRQILQDHKGPLLAHGMGRSYGDAALQPEGIICTERFDHFIAFDTARGIVRAQSGVTMAELMEASIPRGWLPPVIPGTRYVTLGGAFACNVHGKNHWKVGDFAEHVLSIRLTLASGDSVECSPTHNHELFWATAGGMGMTGIIEEVTMKMKPISSSSLKTINCRVESIDDMVSSFERHRNSADYMVGWVDHTARGDDIGRGVFEAASHISRTGGGDALSDFMPGKTKVSIPFFMPSFLLNRYVMGIYNYTRFRKYSSEETLESASFNGFFHPLDAIGHWNRLYGKRGFFQYQCLLPETPGVANQLRALLTAIKRQGSFCYLAVIKYHREGKGLLTFSKAGYSLALDFPNTSRVRALLPQLDRWVADQGGRVYLAKDAMLTADLFQRMYGEDASEWYNLLYHFDPNRRFTSLMSDRLQWKPAA
jgi:FAD/FMN-containing dehydrogenase